MLEPSISQFHLRARGGVGYDGLSEQKQDPNAGHISASEKTVIIISDKGWIFYFRSKKFSCWPCESSSLGWPCAPY